MLKLVDKLQERFDTAMANVFTLSPTEICNYKCFYCFNKSAPPPLPNTKIAPPQEIVKSVDSLSNCVFVNLSGGGEPMLYPDTLEISNMLVEHGHWLGISTNFAIHDWAKYLEHIPPENVVLISASYHSPSEETAPLKKQFFHKAQWTRDHGYNTSIKYIAHPRRIRSGQLQKSQEEFRRAGFRMLILPYRGPYEGKSYPAAFTDKEREIILDGMDRPFLFDPSTTFKGRVCDSGCRMGWIYRHRTPHVVRCWYGESLGTIGDVQWQKTPQTCTTDVCPSRIYMREIGMIQGEPDLRYYFWRDRHLNNHETLNWLSKKHGIGS